MQQSQFEEKETDALGKRLFLEKWVTGDEGDNCARYAGGKRHRARITVELLCACFCR